MNYNSALIIGDMLMRPKALGIVSHFGVVVGPGLVLHNSPGKGEHLSTVGEFSAGEQIRVKHTGADPLGVLARAQKILSNPKKYDPVARNCEHTANEVVQGSPKSPQVVVFVIAAVFGALWFLSRRS